MIMHKRELNIELHIINRYLQNLAVVTRMPATMLDSSYRRISDDILYDHSAFDSITDKKKNGLIMTELPLSPNTQTCFLRTNEGLLFLKTPIFDEFQTLAVILLGPFKEQESVFILQNSHRTGTSPTDKLTAYSEIMELVANHLTHTAFIRHRTDNLALVNEYIKENISQEISAELLQETLLIPRNCLYSLIRKTYGISLGQYVQSLRLEYASELLSDSNYSIMVIADMCGIGDFNYFSRIFKKHFGKSPREFRKENGYRSEAILMC